MNQSALVNQAKQVTLGNYKPSPIVLCEGKGCRVKDIDGNEYLDLSAGIAVLSVGHSHPMLAEAISAQAHKLMHVSNIVYNDKAIALAERLVTTTAFDKVYFCNSGTEANEAMLKLARRFHYEQGGEQRTEIISTEKSFHGRTMGAVSLTGQPKYHEGMGPMLPGIHHVPFNKIDAVRNVLSKKTAAVIVEPIQAEGGIHVGTDAYLRELRQICDESGALLLFDEVQTGYGRTGRFLGQQWSGVTPDACSLAKGIAGGFPLGAMLVTEKVAGGLPPGSHASTFGGNPLACAAGLAVLDIFEQEKLVDRAHSLGTWLSSRLHNLVEDSTLPAVIGTRGQGLLQAIVLDEKVPALDIMQLAVNQGLLISIVGGNALRLSPSLVVKQEELEEGINILTKVLKEYAAS